MRTVGIAIIVLLSMSIACAKEPPTQDEEIQIQDISVNSKGQIEIKVNSSPEYYYVLYGREDVETDTLSALSVTMGQPGTTVLTESLQAYPADNYVVKQFNVDNPVDLDGDGIDDVEEMENLGTLSPLNPAAPVDIRDGSTSITDRDMFAELSYKGPDVRIDQHLSNLEFVKFYILDANTNNPKVYYMNSNTHRAHGSFSQAAGFGGGRGGFGGRRGFGGGSGQMRGEIVYHPFVTAPNGLPGVYRFEFEPNDSYPFEEVKLGYEILAKNMFFLENNWAYYPMPSALSRYKQEKDLYDNSRVSVLLEEDLYKDINFVSLNTAEGYGFLRLMDLDEQPTSRDIVLYESLPNELPRVGGMITTVPQTPLSHVNLRAVQDNVPNAYIKSATLIDPIDDLIGKYVYYKVTRDGYEIREATSAEVDEFYQDTRPTEEVEPVRDLSVKEITPLDEISFQQSTSFGVKAANLAAMRSFGLPETVIPDGYAIPFYFYDEFMKYNGFYDKAEEMINDPDFKNDFAVQEKELKEFRDEIENGNVPDWMEDAFEKLQASFPEGTSIRMRSSTNNEDLQGFSGAGLYDSKTHKPDEGDISKTVLQVYASLWNFRAFDERDFYRIDHMKAAMGVLVHPSFSDELANGVAVSIDPLYQTRNTYYLNTQLGEDLVTNPDALSIPEELLLNTNQSGPDGYTIVRASNQVEDGKLLMSVDQLDELRNYMTSIRDKFRALYNVEPYEDFAIEIEYKVTSDNKLAIKQARPWVMNAD